MNSPRGRTQPPRRVATRSSGNSSASATNIIAFVFICFLAGIFFAWIAQRKSSSESPSVPFNQFDPDGSIRRQLKETQEQNEQLRDLQERSRRAMEPLYR